MPWSKGCWPRLTDFSWKLQDNSYWYSNINGSWSEPFPCRRGRVPLYQVSGREVPRIIISNRHLCLQEGCLLYLVTRLKINSTAVWHLWPWCDEKGEHRARRAGNSLSERDPGWLCLFPVHWKQLQFPDCGPNGVNLRMWLQIKSTPQPKLKKGVKQELRWEVNLGAKGKGWLSLAYSHQNPGTLLRTKSLCRSH